MGTKPRIPKAVREAAAALGRRNKGRKKNMTKEAKAARSAKMLATRRRNEAQRAGSEKRTVASMSMECAG